MGKDDEFAERTRKMVEKTTRADFRCRDSDSAGCGIICHVVNAGLILPMSIRWLIVS